MYQSFNYNLSASNATAIAQSQGATSATLTLNGSLNTGALDTSTPPHQRRIIVTSAGNDSLIGFKVVGLNQALQTISEVITGGNGTFAQSQNDYLFVSSIAPVTLANPNIGTTTASTVTAGTNGVGSSLWQMTDTYGMPLNCSLSVDIITGTINYTVNVTYDDPNNLPTGFVVPNVFTTTMSAATTSLAVTAQTNFFAWQVQVNSGTGTLRATMIQGGIGN